MPDGTRWAACKPGFFLHVRMLSRLFRRLFLDGLMDLYRAGELVFFGDLTGLKDIAAFAAVPTTSRKTEWVVYAKPPFGGLEAVLTYLSRYTHRVAISNHRLVSADAETVVFRWKDYRTPQIRRTRAAAAPTLVTTGPELPIVQSAVDGQLQTIAAGRARRSASGAQGAWSAYALEANSPDLDIRTGQFHPQPDQ
ncbi:putative transposase [Paracoccus sulfuroxidans]|uniref:Putative transposase n=1 Tax=Paracoccus sulfuroxidans TaxID=384678 RepID=A0A562NNU1_9RHOB|nr:putative transposase [Paracoccus sulfuroxidans]